MSRRTGLATGWEPGERYDDTAVRQFVFGWAEALAAPIAAAGGSVARDDSALVCDLGRPASFFNSAVLLQPPGAGEWDDVVGAVEETCRPGTGTVHLWSAWPTPDLTARGWSLAGHPPILLRTPGSPLPEAASDLVVQEVTDAEMLAVWERVAVDGYPLRDLAPTDRPPLFTDAVLSAGLRAWVGFAEGEPAAVGASYVACGLHVLVLGVVLPQFRGRGYWRTMLRTRLAGYPGLPCASVFSDLSRPGARAHGFWPVSRVCLWTRDRC